jgi:hypothetical protein
MCHLIANKHKRIMENPKEEKKDGLQEFLDQKKKMNRSAFRSTNNLDIVVLSSDSSPSKTDDPDPLIKVKLKRGRSNDCLNEMILKQKTKPKLEASRTQEFDLMPL